MRLKLQFELENVTLDIQYRKSIISFIKHAIQEYDENLFKEIYKDNRMKSFTFSAILPKPQFNQDKVTLDNNRFTIIFSAYNYLYALHLYNAFLEQKLKTFSLNRNSMTLKNITMLPEKEIKTDSIKVKMISPVVCRNHNQKTLKDMYYCSEREEFDKYIKINILEQMKAEKLDSSLLEGFKITPIQAKKAIIKLYEKQIETSLGIFELEGKKELLNYLYKARNTAVRKRWGLVCSKLYRRKEVKQSGRNRNKVK